MRPMPLLEIADFATELLVSDLNGRDITASLLHDFLQLILFVLNDLPPASPLLPPPLPTAPACH